MAHGPLVEAADTGPFFHNNSTKTIEGAVLFYSTRAFNESPSGRRLAELDPNGVGISLTQDQNLAVAAFLRVINALENIRTSIKLLDDSRKGRYSTGESEALLRLAVRETEDSIAVLGGAALHSGAVINLKEAKRLTEKAIGERFRNKPTKEAIREQRKAKSEIMRQTEVIRK